MKKIVVLFAVLSILFLGTCQALKTPVYAAETTETVTEAEESGTGAKALAAAIAVGLAAGCGAIGMGWAVAKSNEGISRQPEAEGKIRTSSCWAWYLLRPRSFMP